MRRVLITVAILVLVATALLAAALASLNRIVAANRERILQHVQAAIGRPVTVEALTVSVWSGLGVELQGVRINEDPRFGAGDVLRAPSIIGRATLYPLLQGTLHVSRIDITNPDLRIVRNASGVWNVASLGPGARTKGPPVAGENAGAGPAGLAALIGKAVVENGTVEVIDNRSGQAQTARATDVDLTVTDISETTPIRFLLGAALDSDTRNVYLAGRVGPLNDLAAIPVTIEGEVGPVGRQRLAIEQLRVAGVVTPDAIHATTFEGRAFGGQFGFKGEWPLASGTAWVTGNATGVNVAPIMQLALPEAGLRITGTAEVSVDLRSAGTASEALRRNLRGTVGVTVRDGFIQDFNMVKEVFGTVAGLPGISTLISATAKSKYARLFAEKRTHLETLHGTFRIADHHVRSDDLTLVAADYRVSAAGSVGFDRHVDMVGTLTMSQPLSQEFASDVTKTRCVLDENGQLVIPFRLRGTLGEARPAPDPAGLIRTMTCGMADDLVGTLLGGGQKGTPRSGVEKGLRDLFSR